MSVRHASLAVWSSGTPLASTRPAHEVSMGSVLRDLRIAARRLRAAPAVTAVAVTTLAFGIAATGAIFTVVEDVVLRPLPFAHAERLVRVTADFRRLGVEDGGLSPA